jgi:hypothetical protein
MARNNTDRIVDVANKRSTDRRWGSNGLAEKEYLTVWKHAMMNLWSHPMKGGYQRMTYPYIEREWGGFREREEVCAKY